VHVNRPSDANMAPHWYHTHSVKLQAMLEGPGTFAPGIELVQGSSPGNTCSCKYILKPSGTTDEVLQCVAVAPFHHEPQ